MQYPTGMPSIIRSGVGVALLAAVISSSGRAEPDFLRGQPVIELSDETVRRIREVAGPILGGIEPERLRKDVDTLAGFGTRHTLSDTASEARGIGAARRWLKTAFEAAVAGSGRSGDLACVVAFDSHPMEPDGRRIDVPVEIVNVVCMIPGARPEYRGRLYYVLAHLDSRNSGELDREGDAPGANDAASGVAMQIELARLLSRARLDSTVVLMATSGEEQGLYGARFHAEAAKAKGLDIRAVLNNDTVGDPYGPYTRESEKGRYARGVIRVFAQGVPHRGDLVVYQTISRLGAENDSPARGLARYIEECADLYGTAVKPWVIYRNDRFLRGGDHTPFLELGYPGVRFTVPFEDYNRQHQNVRIEDGVLYGDLPEFVDEAYLADVTALNAAALIHLASAPSEPGAARIITAELDNNTHLRWERSPEGDVAGYEVVWRETTSARWQHGIDVGDVDEAVIELSKDNWMFGVRAYDREGYRSPVAFPIAARE